MKLLYYIISILLITQSSFAKSSFSTEKLRQSCIDYVNQTLGSDVVVTVSKGLSGIEFDDDGITAEINSDEKNLKGNTFLSIEFFKGETLVKKLEVPVKIQIYRDLAVASSSIAKGNSLGYENITTKKEDITRINSNELVGADEIVGSLAARNISKGTVITRSMIESEFKVNRGDKVTVIIRSGAVTVKTSGTALNDASYGKQIRIKREGTKTILSGTVAMDGTVIISAN